MPDITMCQTRTCPMRDGCFRHTATPSKFQIYNDFSHHITVGLRGWECRMFKPLYVLSASDSATGSNAPVKAASVSESSLEPDVGHGGLK